MARRGADIAGTIVFDNFTGGEMSAVLPVTKLPPKYAVRLQNCHVSENGGIAKIPGYAKVNTTSVEKKLTTGFEFKKNDGTTQILSAGEGTIYKEGAGGELTAIKTGLNTSAKVRFASTGTLCIMCNGVDAPMKYNGTTVSALGGTPPATAFLPHVHKGRVWLLERTNKMLATHSALNNAEDYTTANDAGYLDFKFTLRKGDELLGIKSYVDLIVFWFRNHIAIYSGTNPTSSGDFALVQLIEDTGIVETDAALALGAELPFVTKTGIKTLKQVVTTGSLNMGNLSERIDPTLQAEIKANTDNIYAVAHCKDRAWLMFLINDMVRLYSYTWKAWARMVGADVYGMFTTSAGEVYLCGDGYLYKYNSGWTFAGVKPSEIWETGWVPLSKSGVTIYPKTAEVSNLPGAIATVKFQLGYDWNIFSDNDREFTLEPMPSLMDTEVTDIWDNVFLLDHDRYVPTKFPVFGGGKTAKFIFTNTSDLGPIELNQIVLQAVVGGY